MEETTGMTMTHAEVLGRYVGTFVDELVAAGVENVCICPGSRSTPLALTFERHPNIKTWMHLDERSCAYFALGLSTSYSPSVILCSSGTAAANFAPAVVEAAHAHVPLIVLTADRPQELRDLGANQTVDQVRLYGSAAKWFTEMPLPEASEQTLAYVRMVARRCVSYCRTASPGPVHLNFPFREPLIPAGYHPAEKPARQHASPAAEAEVAGADGPSGGSSPATRSGSFGDLFSQASRPMIVCGPKSYPNLKVARQLADSGIPVLADILSDLRCMPTYTPGTLGAYDSFLRSNHLARNLEPDLIVRFGAPPTSKPLSAYLQLHHDVKQIVVAPEPMWPDPDLTASKVIHSDGRAEWETMSRCKVTPAAAWGAAWQEAESRTRAAIDEILGPHEPLSEVSAVTDLAQVIPEAHLVALGNSMPVRDVDTFWPAGRKINFFAGNRGASGIDGVVSTALGAAARAYGKLVLVIGDLSFYHDMNGLLAARRFGLKATIVLINNDGGGIFSFLPQHDDAEHFEALWGTPHGLDFSHVAGLYGVGFQRVTTREEYKAALMASFDADGVQVIEIKTDREENLRLHQLIWDAVAEAVKDVALP